MNPSFSIISTLIEAAKLGRRFAKTFLIFAFILSLNSFAQAWIFQQFFGSGFDVRHSWDNSAVLRLVALSLAMLLISTIVLAVPTAVLLGLLKTPPSFSRSAWSTAKASIRSYVWPLIVVEAILQFLGILIMVLFSFSMEDICYYLGASTFFLLGMTALFNAFFYLILVKYALAKPLIVVENMGPLRALQRSWQMTRGRLGYVVGCYVFVRSADYFRGRFFAHFALTTKVTLITVAGAFTASLFTCYWILLAWVMYVRIKAADAPSGQDAGEPLRL